MSLFSARLAELVRRFHRSADDFKHTGCECGTGWSELGAWVFTCRQCMQQGLDALEALVGAESDQPDLFAPEFPGDVPTEPRSESRR